MTKKKTMKIVGIIPAAGKATRLYPFPCPKELFPIGYQDFMINGSIQKRPKVISQYLVENMINAGASRVVIILGEEKQDVMKYYSDGNRFKIDVAYLYQEKLQGMPFALNLAKSWINNDIVLFGMPDTIIEPKDAFYQLLNFQTKTNADLTLGLFKTENPSKFGMVESDNQGNICKIIDKPTQTKLDYMWGCAVWSRSFTDFLYEFLLLHPFNGEEIVLGDVFSAALLNGLAVKALRFPAGKYIDIGTVDELDSALRNFHL